MSRNVIVVSRDWIVSLAGSIGTAPTSNLAIDSTRKNPIKTIGYAGQTHATNKAQECSIEIVLEFEETKPRCRFIYVS